MLRQRCRNHRAAAGRCEERGYRRGHFENSPSSYDHDYGLIVRLWFEAADCGNWIYLADRFADDPSMEDIGSSELTALIDKIRGAQPFLGEDTKWELLELVYPLEQMRGVMETGENMTIELDDAKDAIPTVMKGCRGKADLSGYKSLWDS